MIISPLKNKTQFIILLILTLLIYGCFENGKLSVIKKNLSSYKGHGGDSVSESVLKEFAPPPVDSEISSKIEKLLDVISPSPAFLTRDGKTLYFNWAITGINQIFKLEKGGFPIQLTSGADKTLLVGLTYDEKSLIISRDEKGNEYPGLFLMDKDGGEIKTVEKKKNVQVFIQFVSKDSKYVYYKANDKIENGFVIYKYDILTGEKISVLDQGEGDYFVIDHQDDGTLLVMLLKGNTSTEYFLYNEKEKILKPLFGQDEEMEYSAQFSPKKNKLIVLTNKFSDFRRLYEFDILTKNFTPITGEENYDISGFSLDEDKKRLFYAINDKGYFSSKILTLKDYKNVNIPLGISNKGVIYHQTLTPISFNNRYAVVSTTLANAPTSYAIYDFKTQKIEKWLEASIPELDVKDAVVASIESYKARDGVDIPLFVYRPKKCLEHICPIILYFHGGPEGQVTPRFSLIRELFMKEGFIWAEPNVRGSDGYGKKWLDADNGPKRLDVITDIEDASLYIKKNWAISGVSPKVGAYGGSYGGYSTYMAMTRFSKSFDAGVAVVGMSNLVSFLNNTAPYRRVNRIAEYGDPEKDREALIKLSPMSYLDQMSKPLLIIHGANDPRVPAGEAIQIYRTMQSKNLGGKLILFPDEGHGVQKRKNRALYYSYIVDFFKKNLL